MSQATSPPSLSQGLCSALPNPGAYLCGRWGDQVKMVVGSPEISFLIILSAFLIGWYVSRHNYKKRLDDREERLKLRDDQIQSLKADNSKLETNNEKLQFQLQAQVSPLSSDVFVIEQMEYEVNLRDKGGAMLPKLRSGMPPAPVDTIFVLEVMVKITATPARVVEDVILSIAGNRIHLPPGNWRRGPISSFEQWLSFDIPQFIESAYHKVHLIMEGEGGTEVKSPVFRVPFSRSYLPLIEG